MMIASNLEFIAVELRMLSTHFYMMIERVLSFERYKQPNKVTFIIRPHLSYANLNSERLSYEYENTSLMFAHLSSLAYIIYGNLFVQIPDKLFWHSPTTQAIQTRQPYNLATSKSPSLIFHSFFRTISVSGYLSLLECCKRIF